MTVWMGKLTPFKRTGEETTEPLTTRQKLKVYARHFCVIVAIGGMLAVLLLPIMLFVW